MIFRPVLIILALWTFSVQGAAKPSTAHEPKKAATQPAPHAPPATATTEDDEPNDPADMGPIEVATPDPPEPAPFTSDAPAPANPDVIPGCEQQTHFVKDSEVSSLALMYAHGFSACPMEIEPVFSEAGRDLSANTLKIRFAGHGLQGSDGPKGVVMADWRGDFARGLEQLQDLGRKRAVIATSTGASLAVDNLARAPKGARGADALVLISPNFGLPRWDSELLLLPLGIGEWIARLALGEYRKWSPVNAEQARYWTTEYPSAALSEMMKAVQAARSAPLEELQIPTLVIYCENDDVLDVKALKKHVSRLPKGKLTTAPCNENTHVLAGRILAPKSSEAVRGMIVEFLKTL